MSIKSKVQPLGDRVLVKRAEAQTTSQGGIVLPDSAKEDNGRGTVVACGKGRRDDQGNYTAMEVKVGDKILFGGYAGTGVSIDGEDFLVMKEDDIVAVEG